MIAGILTEWIATPEIFEAGLHLFPSGHPIGVAITQPGVGRFADLRRVTASKPIQPRTGLNQDESWMHLFQR